MMYNLFSESCFSKFLLQFHWTFYQAAPKVANILKKTLGSKHDEKSGAERHREDYRWEKIPQPLGVQQYLQSEKRDGASRPTRGDAAGAFAVVGSPKPAGLTQPVRSHISESTPSGLCWEIKFLTLLGKRQVADEMYFGNFALWREGKRKPPAVTHQSSPLSNPKKNSSCCSSCRKVLIFYFSVEDWSTAEQIFLTVSRFESRCQGVNILI